MGPPSLRRFFDQERVTFPDDVQMLGRSVREDHLLAEPEPMRTAFGLAWDTEPRLKPQNVDDFLIISAFKLDQFREFSDFLVHQMCSLYALPPDLIGPKR